MQWATWRARSRAAEKAGNKTIRELGAEVDKLQPGLSPEQRAKEIVALMAERNMHSGFVKRVLDAVRTFLQKHGLIKGDLTDAQIAKMLRDAHEYLRTKNRDFVNGTRAAASNERRRTFTMKDLRPLERAKLKAMYRQAEIRKPQFDSDLSTIASEIGGEALTPPLKSESRAIDKIENDLGGDASKITGPGASSFTQSLLIA